MTIKELLVNYKPNGYVWDSNPFFSWKYEQGFSGNQTEFTLKVAKSKEDLLSNQNIIFTTTQKTAEQGCYYAGEKLVSRNIYYFQVTTKFALAQEEKTIVSQVGEFETLLLEQTDWHGKWVSIPINFAGGTLLFRKNMTMPEGKKVIRARAYVVGLGYSEVYVNGKKLGENYLTPTISSYKDRVFYNVYDLTEDFATNITNVFGVMVGNGWYGQRKLLAQIYVDFEDGTSWEDWTANCAGWWVSGGPIVQNSIYGGEVYDAREQNKLWCDLSYEPFWSNGWMYTVLVEPPVGKICYDYLEPIKIIDTHKPSLIQKLNKNTYIYDMHKNFAGFMEITAKGKKGDKIKLIHGEGLCEDGTVNQLNLRTAKSTDVYIFGDDELITYEPRFTYHGFQYLQIECKGDVEIINLIGKQVGNSVKQIGKFTCSNEILNTLHDMAVITEKNNMHGIFSDCPQRDERFGWLNDLASRIFQTLNNFEISSFLPKVVEDMTHTQNEYGCIADTAPFYTGGQPADPVSVCYLLFAKRAYEHYGNKKLLVDQYDSLIKWVDYLLTRQNGMIMDYTYYGDWVVPMIEGETRLTNGIFVSTAYLYWHLTLASQISEVLDKKENAEKYKNLACDCKKAIAETFINNGVVCSGTQAENAITLSLGLCGDLERENFIDQIVKDIIDKDYHCSCGNQGYRHLFYELSKAGYDDLLIKMIINPDYPGWGYMVANGATSVWERWEKTMQNEMHSFNHPMFGSYDGWLYNCLAGINISTDSCGADKFTLTPSFAESLNFVNASIETVRGEVALSWQRQDDKVLCEITVPTNTKAQVVFQNDYKNTSGDNSFTLQGGSYKFTLIKK